MNFSSLQSSVQKFGMNPGIEVFGEGSRNQYS